MSQKIVHAPLYCPQKLLDVGCGTGNVCRHLAQRYPNSEIYGVDITPVPRAPSTPSNISYITGDIKQLAGSNPRLDTLDYIYQRLLICGMTGWPAYIRQMASLLRSGGYLEIHDYAERWYKCSAASPRVPGDEDPLISADWRWMQAMRRGAEQLGLDLDIGLNAQRYMREAGLVEVQVWKYVVPFGTWFAGEKPETKRIGEHQEGSMGAVFSESILPGVTRQLGVGNEEMRELKEECRRCLEGEEGKYWWFYVTVGRKA